MYNGFQKKMAEVMRNNSLGALDKCWEIYGLIEECEQSATALRCFIEFSVQQAEQNGNEHISKRKLKLFLSNGREVVWEIVGQLMNHRLSEEEFYDLLWQTINQGAMFIDKEERVMALFMCKCDKRLPYYELGEGISMENEEYKAYFDKLKTEILRVKFIVNGQFEQRTQQASLLVEELEKVNGKEEKAVMMSLIVSLCEQNGKMSDEED